MDESDMSLKSVILKLSDTSAVVISSSRRTQFDVQRKKRRRDGVLVFHEDTSIGHGEGPQTVIAPAGRTLITVLSGHKYRPA
jgi:Neuraminidase (sialidase)